ncbi:hypothetical protein BCU68_12110 [Vibrio sp. 10N.286.49.B3]|nr:hypothetical protein BCU68_12110 [Vibrio sp. 10N.286.49.B3]
MILLELVIFMKEINRIGCYRILGGNACDTSYYDRLVSAQFYEATVTIITSKNWSFIVNSCLSSERLIVKG